MIPKYTKIYEKILVLKQYKNDIKLYFSLIFMTFTIKKIKMLLDANQAY